MGDFSLVLQSLITPGTHVKKGDVVAEFDRQYMLLRLDDYKANLQQVESSLRILQANLDVDKKAQEQSIRAAKAELDKAQFDLKTIPVRGEIDSEKLRLAEQEASDQHKRLLGEVNLKQVSQAAQWRIGELERDESKIELQRAETNADRMVFRAPMEGITVMATTIRSGEIGQVQQGDMIYPGQMFMQIVDLNSMVVNASINQADVESIRVGAAAKIHFDAYPDLVLPAHVYSVGAMTRAGGFRASYYRQIPVVLKLDKLDPRVIPDLSVSADVVIEKEERAVVVPRESLFTDASSGKQYAFLKTADGWSRRDVELGVMSYVAAVVRSGLRPGEVVAAEWPIREQKK